MNTERRKTLEAMLLDVQLNDALNISVLVGMLGLQNALFDMIADILKNVCLDNCQARELLDKMPALRLEHQKLRGDFAQLQAFHAEKSELLRGLKMALESTTEGEA